MLPAGAQSVPCHPPPLPRLDLAVTLLAISGLGSAWMAGLAGLLICSVPPVLLSRALALQGAGLMFTQGAAFALWGLAAQYLPLTVVIPAAAAAGATVVVTLRPRPGRDVRRRRSTAAAPSSAACGPRAG